MISLKLMTSFLSGIAMFSLFKHIKRVIKAIYPENKHIKKVDIEILREQLKRSYEFFGEEGMIKLNNKFIVVVGVGGVGRYFLN